MEEIHSNPLSSKKIMVIVLLPSRILTAFVSTAGILSPTFGVCGNSVF